MKRFWRWAWLWIICSTVLLSGCWDRQDINDKAFVVGTGIDHTEDGQIEMTIEVIAPMQQSGTSSHEAKNLVFSHTGATIADCLTQIEHKISRTLYWQHDNVILIGEKAAQNDLSASINYLTVNTATRLRPLVVLADGKARDYMAGKPSLEYSLSENIRELMTILGYQKYTVNYVLQQLKGDEGSFVLPLISKTKPGDLPPSTIQIAGLGVIQNNHFIGKMNLADAALVMNVQKDRALKRGIYSLTTDHGTVTLSTENVTSKIKPHIEDGHWKATVVMDYQFNIEENTTDVSFSNYVKVSQLEAEIEEIVQDKMANMIEKWKKEGVDLFGFANAFHIQFPEQWKRVKDDWAKKFSEVDVEIQIQASVLRPGNLR